MKMTDKEFHLEMVEKYKRMMLFKHYKIKNKGKCEFGRKNKCGKKCKYYSGDDCERCLTSKESNDVRQYYECALRGGANAWKKKVKKLRVRNIFKAWDMEHFYYSCICFTCDIGENEWCSTNGVKNPKCKQPEN